MRLNIRFKKMDPRTREPRHGSREAAGYDLETRIDYDPVMCLDCYEMIPPQSMRLFRSGIAVEMPKGFYGDLRTRSSALKKGLLIPATVIDSDFVGEIKIPVYNTTGRFVRVDDGERLAQLVVQEHAEIAWSEVDELRRTERGEGGFGSTDGKTITI